MFNTMLMLWLHLLILISTKFSPKISWLASGAISLWLFSSAEQNNVV